MGMTLHAATKPKVSYPTFTFAELESLLANPKTSSVDPLVKALPQAYRENYTEIFSSRGQERHSVSPKAPRIIAYGNDAKLIVSFMGDKDHPESFNKIQIVRFNDATKEWEFYQTQVPAPKNARGSRSKKIRRSVPNVMEVRPDLFGTATFYGPALSVPMMTASTMAMRPLRREPFALSILRIKRTWNATGCSKSMRERPVTKPARRTREMPLMRRWEFS
jgi:hypothetical protein